MRDLTTGPEALIAQAYADAYAVHGDLSLAAEAFSSQIHSIINRRAGALAPVCEFISRLHLSDLYLALACAQGDDAAWCRFILSYGGYIRKVSLFVCHSRERANDIADSLLSHVFLPDATGRSRMASYEGLSPLSAWLAAIIKNRTFSQRRLDAAEMESLDSVKHALDESSIYRAEADIRASRYRRLIDETFEDAAGLLSDRERLILRLRFERQLRVSDIAKQLGVTPHAITQQIDRSGRKLRRRVIHLLTTRYRLGPAVIQECVADLLNDRERAGSVLNLAGP